MPIVQLASRAVVAVEGPEAGHFLQNLITTDLDALAAGEAMPGALLTPQGKIMFDFLISRRGEQGFRLDLRADAADDFLRRLMLYRLRAKVEISKLDQELVFAGWEIDSASSDGDSSSCGNDSAWLRDARFPAQVTVFRRYGAAMRGDAEQGDWDLLRIAHGIAESGSDYRLGDAFPHDVLLDETGGIGFRKGCYVGQEVVSRMQHRGTARRRVMTVAGDQPLPGPGTPVEAGGRPAGELGSVSGRSGLAIVRIDRIKDALDSGAPITAGGVAVELAIPDWARYRLPEAAGEQSGG